LERSCRQLLFLFIRSLPGFSGDLPPGMSPGQPSERSCRQLLFLFIRLLPALSRDLPPGIGRIALGTILSTLFFLFIRCAMIKTLMSSLRPFVRKSKEDYVRKNKADYAGKNDVKSTETWYKGHAWKKRNRGQENGRNRRLWIPQRPRKHQPRQVTDCVRLRRHGAVVRVSVVDHMELASSRPIGVS